MSQALVVGIFTCGHEPEGEVNSIEAVHCGSEDIPLVSERMKEHSALEQCRPEAAVIVLNCESVEYNREDVTHFHSYRKYLEAWNETHRKLGYPVIESA